jgi:hypothetical protein
MQLSPCSKIHIFMHVIFPLFQVTAKGQVDALSKELFALSTVTGILSTLLATCVIVLTNKIYNLFEQIVAIVSLFSNSMVVTDHREFYMFLLV